MKVIQHQHTLINIDQTRWIRNPAKFISRMKSQETEIKRKQNSKALNVRIGLGLLALFFVGFIVFIAAFLSR